MNYPGFNLKVRKVANGYTVHRISTSGDLTPEEHDDHVAMTIAEVHRLVINLVVEELGYLEPEPESESDKP